MNEQPNYYAILTADVRYDKSISAMAKLLYAEITALAHKEGFCWASNKYFADLYGVDRDTVRRWMTELARAGYVRVEVDQAAGNMRRVYLEPYPKNTAPYRKNTGTLPQKYGNPYRKNTDITIKENNINNIGPNDLNEPDDHRGKPSAAKERIRQALKAGSLRQLAR